MAFKKTDLNKPQIIKKKKKITTAIIELYEILHRNVEK